MVSGTFKIRKSERGQRLCDARDARGELCECIFCIRKRTSDNAAIREAYGEG